MNYAVELNAQRARASEILTLADSGCAAANRHVGDGIHNVSPKEGCPRLKPAVEADCANASFGAGKLLRMEKRIAFGKNSSLLKATVEFIQGWSAKCAVAGYGPRQIATQSAQKG